MIYIGLDLSITSTGVCVYDSDNKTNTYYIIGSKLTKKTLAYSCDYIQFIQYNKQQVNPKDEYYIKERAKLDNIYNIVQCINQIIEKYHPQACSIEGVSYGSNGGVVDLAGLNYMVRMTLLQHNVNDIYVISPTENKKFATSNGSADKSLMISAWHKSDPRTVELPSYIKTDDIADAYFLARYGEMVHNRL